MTLHSCNQLITSDLQLIQV